MSRASLEKRVTALETQLAVLQKKVGTTDTRPWWRQIFGQFANDPAFTEAMRIGREYRESLRPKQPAKKRAPRKLTNGRS